MIAPAPARCPAWLLNQPFLCHPESFSSEIANLEMMMKTLLAVFSALILVTGVLEGQTRPASQNAAARPSLTNPASLKDQAPATFKAKFSTTKGDFVVEVTRAWAPLGADRFYNLVKYHFFDGAAFFRVLPGFVAQFGLSPKPEISRIWASAAIHDDPVTQSNLTGFLTFATAGPNTRTTQLFINLADNVSLDRMGFAPFGKVTEGMEVVQQFYSGYGEGAPGGNGPAQDRITNEGKPYLDKGFPLLDSIKTAVIVK
jgi:peptidyl-prolyl cis-trans isomerase A (cyclophilin A)